MDTIKENIRKIEESLAGHSTVLCAVTKFVSPDRINEAIACGISLIGENRAQELCEKYDALKLDGVKVHFIGQLQTNKVKMIIDKVDMIESVDSLRLAQEISRRALSEGKRMQILIEVNIGGEAAKGGIASDMLLPFAKQLSQLDGISLCGIMSVIPHTGDSAQNKAYFTALKQLSEQMKKTYPNAGVLSMGMSEDYREAVECGSTIVRIGRGIFGERKTEIK